MVLSVLANQYTYEAAVSGTVEIPFPWRSRQIVITNDDDTRDLDVVITRTTLTLGPGETLSANLWLNGVTVSGSVPVRVWAWG